MTSKDETSEKDVSMPILSVDESLSTEERLTDNAVNNILPARYLIDDESPDDMFRRVANNVAKAEESEEAEEEWAEEFYDVISNLTFCPNSPTLFNAGAELQQLSACFVLEVGDSMAEPDEKGRESILDTVKNAGQIFKCLDGDERVHTENGYIPISEVSVGDTVFQHNGEGKVTETHTYDDAEMFKVSTESGLTITGTPNHKLFSNGEPVRIDELKRGDELTVSMNWFEGSDSSVSLDTVPQVLWNTSNNPELHDKILSGVSNGKSDYEISENTECSASTVQRHRKGVLGIDSVNNSGAKYKGGPTKDPETGYNEISQPEILTEELAWLVGLWIGDGSYHQDGVRFHLSSDPVIERVRKTVKKRFNYDISQCPSKGCTEVGIYSSAIKRYWKENFGDSKNNGSYSACIPQLIWSSNRSIAFSFLRGLFDADGTLLRGNYPSLTTTSEELASDVQQLLHGLGIEANIWFDGSHESRLQVRPVEGSIDRHLDLIGVDNSYTVERDISNVESLEESTTTVRAVERAGTGTVYDITVSDEHEYTASSIRSHNSGGGVGYSFSHLRPRGSHIESTDSETSGPLAFMRLFDEVCNTVKQGGCIAADSRVMTDSGYKPLSSVHNAPPMRDSHGSNELVYSRGGEYNRVVESSDSGPMDVVTLTTDMGYELVGTPNHPILAVRDGELEFAPLGELDEDDTVALDQSDKRRHNWSTLTESDQYPSQMNADLSRFLGLLWADGTFDDSNDRLVFTLGKEGNADQSSKEFLEKYANELRENLIVRDEETRGKGKCWRCVINSKNLVEWMKENGLDKGDDLSELPEPLYESTSGIGHFLGGLTADACTSIDANTYEYTTAYPEFASEIQDLLLLCGIPSRVSKVESVESRYSDKPRYTVRVTPGSGTQQFDNTVSHFLSNDGMEPSKGGERQNQIPFADSIVGRVLEENFEKNEQLPNYVDSSAMKELRRYERGERTPSLEKLRNCFEKVGIDADTIEELSEDYLYDSVDSVEESGQDYVYDIEVIDGEHEYVSRNFIVHNKRRGAQMGIMRADHPDIGRFVVSKREEGNFSNFNISTAITDEFKEAVEDDELYTLYDPRTEYEEPFEVVEQTAHFYNEEYKDQPEAVVNENVWRDHADSIEAWDWENGETVSLKEKWEGKFSVTVGEEMELPARFIWDLIIDGAWRNGEPGLFYLDETNREHSFDVEEYPEHKVSASNPCGEQPLCDFEACLHGEETILTDDGIRQIENFDEGLVSSDSGPTEISTNAELIPQGEKDTIEVTLDGGMTIRCTPDHTFLTDKGEIEAENLIQENASVKWMENNPISAPVDMEKDNAWKAFTIGWMHGDGWLTEGSIGNSFNSDDGDFELKDRVLSEYHGLFGERAPLKDDGVSYQEQTDSMDAFDMGDELGFNYGRATERVLPDWFYTASENDQLAFLRGLFTADAGIGGKADSQIQYATSSHELVDELQKVLGSLGIQTRRYVTEFEERNDQLRLSITTESAELFMEYIGLETSCKQEQFNWDSRNWTEDSYLDVISIEESEPATVYDLTVPKTHVFHTNGALVHNCNLGHINLSLMLNEDAITFDKWLAQSDHDYDSNESAVYDYLYEEAVNWEQLQDIVHSGTRFLDNVVTMSDFPLEQIDETVEGMRKIGLGVMGWAQMLYQMGIRYGSHESLAAARLMMNFIDKEATAYSHELAKERDSFEVWDESKYANPTEYEDWFWKHAHENPNDWEDGYPVRNHNVTTVAPTGTTSMIADTSGGIEPVFSVAYKKNVGEDIQGDEMLVEFDSYFLDALKENEERMDHSVEEIKRIASDQMENNEFEGVRGLPIPESMKEVFVTTNDIPAEEHTLMQRAFQDRNDSGISKSINCPKDATHADVHNAYMLGLADGDEKFGSPIKGLTVYRDQSREEQVKTTQEYSDKEVENAQELLEDLGYRVEESNEIGGE